ncbi:MAG: asparagine synthase (glutamine-hydrolyzing), partial [Pseudomonadales bacterium]|nr:asparagine synthase (glutamine-hydrolyzing) [Pseudomonadales bacterium]
MCGIAGVLGPQASTYANDVRAMSRLIRHRGPDSEGFWESPDQSAALGFRRLAIIDKTESANQPMHGFRTPHITIVFNGEIYNHRHLRERLTAEGCQFRTDHSDTEVIIEGYQQWGIDKLLHELNGMFAFALIDRNNKVALLARDRLGLKPLYYTVHNQKIAFASEIKAFQAWSHHSRELNLNAFSDYLSFRSIMAPETMFAKIKKLEPGGLLSVNLANGELQSKRWWDPLTHATPTPRSFEEAAEQFAELQADALRLQLESDTPLGLLLSGGVDSGLLLKTAQDESNGLSTFTAYYPQQEQYNEHIQARALAARFRSKHFEIPIASNDYLNAQFAVSYHQDEPIAAPICTSVFYLCQAARQAGVPVLLSGEGSDEAYFGYENWLLIRRALAVQHRYPMLSRILGNIFNPLFEHYKPYSPFPEFAARAKRNQLLFWSGAIDFSESSKHKLLNPQLFKKQSSESTYDRVIKPMRTEFERHRSATDHSCWMSYTDLRFRLPELMLMRMDKMGMAFSVETRAPLIDHRMIELAMSIPEAWNKKSATKPLIKHTAGKHLERSFVHQRKKGFAAPVREWRDQFSSNLKMLSTFAQRTNL